MKILILLAQFESFVIIEPLDFGSGEMESVSRGLFFDMDISFQRFSSTSVVYHQS